MSSSSSEKVNMQNSAGLEAQRTNDSTQPGMPMYHRRLANPAPLGLLSFATSVFLVSVTGLGTRGVEAPNIIITTMIFFGGVCQYIAGIMEFCLGNTVRTTKKLLSGANDRIDSLERRSSHPTPGLTLPMRSSLYLAQVY